MNKFLAIFLRLMVLAALAMATYEMFTSDY
jgi:hypothetical protein